MAETNIDKMALKRHPFQKTRAGVPLSKEEVAFIKKKRKELRADLKKEGVTSKKDFEVTASSLGYYFDKQRKSAIIMWVFSGRVLPILLAGVLAGLGIIYSVAKITQMRGFFTVNMTEDMFREGFSLRQTFSSQAKSSVLNVGNVGEVFIPETSIYMLPAELDTGEGDHSGFDYFAYSFYITNEGASTVSYEYSLNFSAVRNNLDRVLWLMVIKSEVDPHTGETSDTQMSFHAKLNEQEQIETIPNRLSKDDNPLYFPYIETGTKKQNAFLSYYMDMAKFPDQFEKKSDDENKFKLNPIPFVDDTVIATDVVVDVKPGDTQKYTIVIWLEGEDSYCVPDNQDELIGSSAGVSMKFNLTR